MRKIITVLAAILAFICNNEIITLLIIAAGALVVAIFLLKAWASKETEKMPASFDVDWGRK